MATALALETVVVAKKDHVSTEMGKERVLLQLTSGKYYSLNRVGARIWALLSEPVSLSRVCDVISGEYGVERSRCENDVLALVGKLRDAGFVDVQA